MVFSFFKKEPEKMVAKPAAVPRAKEKAAEVARPSGASPLTSAVTAQSETPVQTDAATKDLPPLEYSDFVFSESSPQFVLDDDVDPVDAEAEEAAILYANAQDAAVSSVLENAVRIHHFGPGERLWLMLFDLYRLTGKKTEFETLEIEYAQSFEKSPPSWRDKSKGKVKPKEMAAGSMLFNGELIGGNSAAFDAIARALEKNPRLRLDMSKIGSLDAMGCSQMLQLLQCARKAKRDLELLGRDVLFKLVEQQVEVGCVEHEGCWLLLLELCQLQGLSALFEEVAINYAITFEVSPPSWDDARVAAPEPAATQTTGDATRMGVGEAYALQGEVKAFRFADLAGYADVHDPVLIDCSALTRMDFISAGALLNVLTTVRNRGKQIVIYHPNHLVAELLSLVGLSAIATIVFSNN